jgi:uroporphyrinogen-III decarboxylase
MQLWASTSNSSRDHYFKYVSVNRATYDIKDGKVSPWLVLNCGSGKDLLNKLDDIQLNSISAMINPEVWIKKFKKQKDDLQLVKDVVKESGL